MKENKIEELPENKYVDRTGLSREEWAKYGGDRITIHEGKIVKLRAEDVRFLSQGKETISGRGGIKSYNYKFEILNSAPSDIQRAYFINQCIDTNGISRKKKAVDIFGNKKAALLVTNDIGRKGYAFSDKELALGPKLYSNDGRLDDLTTLFLEFLPGQSLEEKMHIIDEQEKRSEICLEAVNLDLLLVRLMPLYHEDLKDNGACIKSLDIERAKKKIKEGLTKLLDRKSSREFNHLVTLWGGRVSEYFESGTTYALDDPRPKHKMLARPAFTDLELIEAPMGYQFGGYCDPSILNRTNGDLLARIAQSAAKKDTILAKYDLHLRDKTHINPKQLERQIYDFGFALLIQGVRGAFHYHETNGLTNGKYKKIITEHKKALKKLFEICRDKKFNELADFGEFFEQ